MSFWNRLLQISLIGTDRPWKWDIAASDPVAQLLNEAYASNPDAAGTLLRLAGAASVCQQAGWIPPSTAIALPVISTTASVESRAEINSLWEKMLSEVLDQGPPRLLQQVLFAIDQKQWRIPHTMLIRMLDLGRQNTILRAYIQPVLGERGRWLAMQNPQWAYAAGTSEQADIQTQWEYGNLEQRCTILRTERAKTPDAARGRLQADWSKLPAKDRTALISLLQVGLSQSDETFLTQQLKDRAQDVRTTAADLLAALAGSAYSLRMIERIAPLVVNGAIYAPEQTDAGWKADQLETERPRYAQLGERAWWLYQLTRRTPLSWWTQHTGLSPHDLVELAKKSDWKDALLTGWHGAFQIQRCADWHAVMVFDSHLDSFQACLLDCPAHTYLELSLSQRLVELFPRFDHLYHYHDALLDLLCILHHQSLPLIASLDVVTQAHHVHNANYVIRIRNHIFEEQQ